MMMVMMMTTTMMTEDPDYQPPPAEGTGDTSFASMDEEEVASASMFSTLLPPKTSRKGKTPLKSASLEEPQGTPDPSSPSGPNKNTRRIWRHEDFEEFQVPDSRGAPREAVKTPLQFFQRLFTDSMIERIAHRTSLDSAHEVGDPISTRPRQTEDFLTIVLLMGVSNFPARQDCPPTHLQAQRG